MSRWIEVEPFLKEYCEPYPHVYMAMSRAMADAPSIEIITCGECRHCTLDIVVQRREDGYEKTVNLCRNPKHTEEWSVPKDWYCADGVRRESE